MTKFIFLTDSHFGANPPGYQQQRAHPELLPEIVSTLRDYIAKEKIDFVLHGGDLIDFTNEENIRASARLFESLDVPVYLCLGNHDLTAPDALQQWLRLAPQFFPGGKPEYSLTHDCMIHVAPNHWGDRFYHWETDLNMSFDARQLDFLEQSLSAATDRPHLLLTHGPVFGLPPQQTGLEEELHSPEGTLTAAITALAAKHPHLCCVLGGHNHFNMCVKRHGTHFITCSALDETPFEIKQFEATQTTVTMTTIFLINRINGIHRLNGTIEYDFNKTYVQGRPTDRTFTWNL